jgi:hypothetical protein
VAARAVHQHVRTRDLLNRQGKTDPGQHHLGKAVRAGIQFGRDGVQSSLDFLEL